MISFRFRDTLAAQRSQTALTLGNVLASPSRTASGKIHATHILILFIVSLLVLNTEGEGWAKHLDNVQEIPFKLYRNHLVVVMGSLGGLERKNLVIDTGTNPTMVDVTIAHELGLERVDESKGSINFVEGTVPTYYSVLPTLELGPIHRESMPVAVTDLSWLREQCGIHVDAVIGLDALAQLNFQIDYQSRTITFGAIRIPKSAVPLADVDRLLMVQAELNGIKAKLMIDTGGSALVLFAGKLPESTNWRTLGSTARFSSLAGQTVLQKVQLRELRIGETNLSGSLALVREAPTCCDFQGILGISARQFKRIAFDFRRRLVGFELRDSNVLEDPPPCGAWSDSHICRNANAAQRLIGIR